MEDDRPKFRFMDLEIWQDAIEVGGTLFDIADSLEAKKMYRFAEQLRGSGLSMSNNIAEGSGSSSKRDFSNFLNIARRSTFENANVVLVLEKRSLIDQTWAGGGAQMASRRRRRGMRGRDRRYYGSSRSCCVRLPAISHAGIRGEIEAAAQPAMPPVRR